MESERGQSPAPRRGRRPRGREVPLSRELVLATAVELAEKTSVDQVSVRGIAAQLGVSAMAIYNHVAGKAEIERHLLAHIFRTQVRWVDLNRVTSGPDILRAVFINQYNLAVKYPDMFLVFAHHSNMPEVMRFQEQMYDGFTRCGLPPAQHRIWARIFGSFVHGSVALYHVSMGDAWERVETAYLQLDKRLYPHLAAARSTGPTAHRAVDREMFELELDTLIEALLLFVGNGEA